MNNYIKRIAAICLACCVIAAIGLFGRSGVLHANEQLEAPPAEEPAAQEVVLPAMPAEGEAEEVAPEASEAPKADEAIDALEAFNYLEVTTVDSADVTLGSVIRLKSKLADEAGATYKWFTSVDGKAWTELECTGAYYELALADDNADLIFKRVCGDKSIETLLTLRDYFPLAFEVVDEVAADAAPAEGTESADEVESVHIEIIVLDEKPIEIGSSIRLQTVVAAPEGAKVNFTWEYSLDGANWQLLDCTDDHYSFTLDETNALYYWRVVADI